jgi:uncharacterized protein YciI
VIYAFICKDGGDKTQIRRDLLIEHLRYIESVIDKVVVAGPCAPMTPSDVRQFEGSVMMYQADTPAEARSMFERDPYFKNKIWDSYEMMNFSPVAGNYIGGQTWEIVDGKMMRKDPRTT